MKIGERSSTDYLNEMLDYARKARRFADGVTYEEFRDNDEKICAVMPYTWLLWHQLGVGVGNGA